MTVPIRTIRTRHRDMSSEYVFGYNSDGAAAMAGGVAEMDGESSDLFKFKKPTADDLANCMVIGDVDIAKTKPGALWEVGTHPVKYDGDNPAVGDYMGSKKDSWYAKVSPSGTWIVRDVDTANKVAYVYLGGTGGGTGIAIVKITGGGPGEDHTGDVHANGKEETATESGVDIKVLQISGSDTIPSGTYLMASKQNWGGTDYWTVNPARDY